MEFLVHMFVASGAIFRQKGKFAFMNTTLPLSGHLIFASFQVENDLFK